MYLGGHPVEFGEWIQGFLGDETDNIRHRAHSTVKWRPDELEELYEGLKEWLKELEKEWENKIW